MLQTSWRRYSFISSLLFLFRTDNYVPIQTRTGAIKHFSRTVFSTYTSFLPIKFVDTNPAQVPHENWSTEKFCTRKNQSIQSRLKRYIPSVFTELRTKNLKNKKGNSTTVLHHVSLAYCHTTTNYVPSYHIPSFSVECYPDLPQVLVDASTTFPVLVVEFATLTCPNFSWRFHNISSFSCWICYPDLPQVLVDASTTFPVLVVEFATLTCPKF